MRACSSQILSDILGIHKQKIRVYNFHKINSKWILHLNVKTTQRTRGTFRLASSIREPKPRVVSDVTARRAGPPAAPSALRRRERGAELHSGSGPCRSPAARLGSRQVRLKLAAPPRLRTAARAHHVAGSEFARAFLTAPHTGPRRLPQPRSSVLCAAARQNRLPPPRDACGRTVCAPRH